MAARIALTEAENAGNIRLQVALLGLGTSALDMLDILPPTSGTKYFSVDDNALTQVHTPGQLLSLADGGKANLGFGGFFPNGVNGNIKMSSDAANTGSGTVAKVAPGTSTVTEAQVTLDASSSVSGKGNLTYTYSIAPGAVLRPAILQRRKWAAASTT